MSTEMLKELLITEKDLLQQAIAKAKDLMGIEEKTGRVILRIPRGSLGQRQIAALYLIGQYFAKQMEKTNSASLSLNELSDLTSVDSNTLSGRLSELVTAGLVRRIGKARFEINQFQLNSILDEIALSRRKSELIQPASSPLSEEVDKAKAVSPAQSYPTVSKNKGVTDGILSLLETDWGKTPRDWAEISRGLRHNALHYSKGSITGTLTLLTQSGRVRRIKEGHSYKYVLR